MASQQASPISQLLRTLGLTREDLEKHSHQMRQFLTADDANYQRALEKTIAQRPLSPADTRSVSKSITTESSSTSSRPRARSYAFRAEAQPVTPVKSEHVDGPPPLRHYNSMEMVIERQRRQSKKERKERRERERINSLAPPSSPCNASSQSGVNLDSFMHSRVEGRVLPDESHKLEDTTLSEDKNTSIDSIPPETPQRNKYYRDHTILSGVPHSNSYKEQNTTNVGSPIYLTMVQSHPHQLPAYPFPYVGHFTSMSTSTVPGPSRLQTSFSTLPVTPQNQRTYNLLAKPDNSPLPPSSPPPASSPAATPHRPVVNLVSSPGPMGPPPDEDEYDSLPYTLPPGPYSSEKPDLSYAALVGQAILSSPEHRLTLQEIYDWITIVHPYFKRGETTWMNSIRHVLSTTICFRKVTRERSLGRTQWAIWDEDLECFEGGGFRKQFCKDMMKNDIAREHGSRGKGKTKKRTGIDDGVEERKLKRLRKDFHSQPSAGPSTTPFAPVIHPLFPPIRPASHHQPYYESCVQNQPLPAGVIFPPLPAGIGYPPMIASSSLTPSDGKSHLDKNSSKHNDDESVVATPLPQPDARHVPASSSTSIPELTPNRSSSSPPSTSSDIAAGKSTSDEVRIDDFVTVNDGHEGALVQDNASPSLGPVKYWGRSPKIATKPKASEKTLRPGIKLDFDGILISSDEEDTSLLTRPNKILETKKFTKNTFPPLPESPTLNRKAASQLSKVSKASDRKSSDSEHPTTHPPCTPPRRTQQLPVSSVRTPLSSKGVNPAALHAEADDGGELGAQQLDLNKTPRKRVISSGAPIPAPVTPRRLIFPANQNESPFRTPAGGGVFSPFRTPNSRSIFDPHDPGALLDEELNRMGASAGDSPAGLFGKGRGSLLYDSPGFSTSPSQYSKWW